ncbi:hypothetical protein [Chamaesiphon sp. GL140_3_metabinner_50]|uniref:hypothetical protein n=1 Tax=Chamaesiphon sp. GL140_3_metabinner_50 TaxID=2970812 RepID=UPI0025F9D6F5|nr:hypothetical protein [Chamaesiphon sp. GL140_3_metabinner_50]
MYSQLFAYYQTNYKLVCYCIAISGWYLLLASSANAQTQPIIEASLPENRSTTEEIAPTVSNNIVASTPPENATAAPAKADESTDKPTSPPLVKHKVAQVTIPLPTGATPILSVPIILPNLIPRSSPIVPINSVLTPGLLFSPNNTPAVPSTNTPTSPTNPAAVKDSRFIIEPKVLDPRVVDPFSTQFIINGNRISHFTNTAIVTGFETGNFRNTDLSFNIFKLIGAKNVQSVTTDRVVRVSTEMESTGISTVAQYQEINVSVAKDQTLLGVRQQISLIGNCLDGSGGECTYIPGITIGESDLDRKLQPRVITVTSQFGDRVSAASSAAIREPGFQGGANGQNFGIDLTIPAIGLVNPPEGSPPQVLTGERQENFKTGLAVNYTRMQQNFATNGKESTLERTVRSLNYINGDRNQLVNALTNAIGQILPSFSRSIAPGEPGARIVVNPNLYQVASAIRIPDNSLTVYQAGTGYAASFGKDPKVPPGASHQALWVGMSPVVEREFSRDYRYNTIREPRIVTSGGGEGGNVPIAVTLNNFGFNSGGLQNAYGQGYVTVLNRDVSRVDTDTIRQRTDYYPHISFTGANLNENSLWRYYTGAIVNAGFQPKTTSNLKAYIGTDYAIVNPRGLSLNFAGIGYLNPDPEYSSQLSASGTQSIQLGSNPRNSLVLGFNSSYIVDGSITLQSLPVRSAQSYVNAGLALNFGDISVGGTQFFGNILPESVENKTVFNIGWKVTNKLKVGGFVSVFDRNISTNPFGANLSYELDANSDSAIYLGWNAAEIDFRRTLGPTANVYKDNTVSISIRYGF